MNDERFDLSALDLDRDPERVERMIGGIMWRARMELARRAALRDATAFEIVATWYRPARVAAAAIAAVSLTLLATFRPQPVVPTGAYMSAADVPAAMSVWYEEDRVPTASELLVVANEGGN
jgi:hypothetical protein